MLHAKSLNTDKAWEVHDFLIDTYFRVQELKTSYTDTFLKIYQEQNQRYNELLSRMEKLESKQTKSRKLVIPDEEDNEIKIVLDFIDECCMKRINNSNRDGITTKALYDFFVKWCYQVRNVTPPKKTDFIKGVCKFFGVSYKHKDKTRRRAHGTRYYLITLRPEYINK